MALTGCGFSYDPETAKAKTYPARGRILLPSGSPLWKGQVTLHPKDKTKPIAMAIIGKDGTFTLQTYNANDGAAVGAHVVTVKGTYYTSSGTPLVDKNLPIPKKYQSVDTSDLLVEIGEKENTLNLQLTGS